VRPFRLAATLCAAQLVSSVVGVRTQLLDALAQVIQQRDAEQKKGARANKVRIHMCVRMSACARCARP